MTSISTKYQDESTVHQAHCCVDHRTGRPTSFHAFLSPCRPLSIALLFVDDASPPEIRYPASFVFVSASIRKLRSARQLRHCEAQPVEALAGAHDSAAAGHLTRLRFAAGREICVPDTTGEELKFITIFPVTYRGLSV